MLLKFVSNVNKMSERNIVESEHREVGNLYRDTNSSDCSNPTAENKVFHNIDFYTEFPMPERKLEPHTENILVSEENLNDDASKVSHRLQTYDHLRRPGEFSYEYSELPTNHRSSSVDSTNLNPLVSTMPLNSAVDVRLKSEYPPAFPPSLSGSPATEVYNTLMLMPSGFENNQGQPSESQSKFQPFIPKYSHETTDNSTPLVSVAPSMDSTICASLVCEIPTDILQLRSPTVQVSDNVYENTLIMDIDKPIMSVTSEPFEDNKVRQSIYPSHFDTAMLQNTVGSTDNLPNKSFNVDCNLNIDAEARGFQRNTLLMNTNALNVNLPLACAANLTEKNVANAVKNHSSMPNISAPSDYEGNSFLMSTVQLHTQDYTPSSAAGPSRGNNESFVDMDILNMSSVAGPSGYGSNKAVVSKDSETPVTPVPAANFQFKYVCRFCEYKTNRKSNLGRHIPVHSEERPFECNYCHKLFKWKSVLITHLRKHTGEKPYKCGVCGYRCTYSATMNRHKRRHTRK